MSPSKRLADLTPDERVEVCKDTIAAEGPVRMITCDGGLVVSTGGIITLDECVDDLAKYSDECAATVADKLACEQASTDRTDADVCGFVTPEPCLAFPSPACDRS